MCIVTSYLSVLCMLANIQYVKKKKRKIYLLDICFSFPFGEQDIYSDKGFEVKIYRDWCLEILRIINKK